jgi:hypothetical protein
MNLNRQVSISNRSTDTTEQPWLVADAVFERIGRDQE